MKTITTTKTVYEFNELSEEAQENAIAKNYDINLHDDWYEYVYGAAETAGKLLGIDIDKIYFSGFCFQGDGACFEGQYTYKKGSVKAVKSEFPTDLELQRIALDLYNTQRLSLYSLSATVKHRGRYYHELCTDIEVYDDLNDRNASETQEDDIKEALRGYMQWIYSSLEKEHEYLTSNSEIREALISNEYFFDIHGDLA